MKRIGIRFLALSFTALIASTAMAGEIGDKAAEISVKNWIRGKPIKITEGKKKHVFVVEFWATWCPPCRQSIPHLTEMQKKFKDKDVIFIGVTDESEGTVRPFVEKMGDQMAYRVVCDDGQKTNNLYMKAFGQQGIPTAFVVDKTGHIVWVGHPMNGLEEVVAKVADGKYDLEAAKKEAAAERDAQRKMAAAALKMDEYFDLAGRTKKSKRMPKLAKTILKSLGANPMAMNEFSWRILTDEKVKHRDLKTAMKAAQLAFDGTGGKEPAVIDTYARALFMNGKIEAAVEQQERAIELCKDSRMKAELQKTLEEYKEKAPKKA